MSRHPARLSGVTVTLLDLTGIEADALAYANAQKAATAVPGYHPPVDLAGKPIVLYTEARVHGSPWALGTAQDGSQYLVCEEGVGWPLNGKPNTFDVHCSTRTDTGSTFAMFPTCEVNLTSDEVRALPTGETVDLSVHVRVFGSRLEDNFRMWYRTLNGGRAVQ